MEAPLGPSYSAPHPILWKLRYIFPF